MSDQTKTTPPADDCGPSFASLWTLGTAQKEIERLEKENQNLLWIIGTVRQDLHENAPNRAEVFLTHQMKELGL